MCITGKWNCVIGLLEITLEETFKAASVACFVFCHFVNSVVDSIQTFSLGALGDFHLAVAGTAFCFCTLFEVGLGVPYAVANELGEAAGVVCLFESIALECFGDFGIALTVCLTRHGEIHAHLGAFAFEVSLQTFHDVFGATFGNADDVFGDIYALFLSFYFLEL